VKKQTGKIDRCAVFRRSHIVFVLVSAVLVFGGCSGGKAANPNPENEELKFRVNELEQEVDEKDAQIKRYEKEYELRNILDIEARKLLSSLNAGIFGETEKDLLSDNMAVKEDRLEISFQDNDHEILFFQNKLDFESVRQRYYHLDERGEYITGYEVMNSSDDVNERISSRGVLVFTFVEEPSGWKLVNIDTDR